MKRYLMISAAVAVAAWAGATAQFQVPGQQVKGAEVHPDYGVPPNAPGQKPAFAGQTDAPEARTKMALEVTTVAEGLATPWAFEFLPDGRMLVTEKGNATTQGRMRIVGTDGKLSEPVGGLPQVDTRGQGGLLDVALAPDYAKTQTIYWSYSEPREGGENNTAVARGRLVDGAAPRVDNMQVIFHQVPSMQSPLHFGSRLVWNRDGTLFVTMGDRSIIPGRMQAQNLDVLIGKIARINADGSIPNDNPFVGKQGVRPEIWSYGHRNIQAATLHPTSGELWEVEHGTRGGDEVNIARKGQDYGWPTIAYGIEYQGGQITGGIQQKEGMEQPIYYWDPNIAPSGMTFYTGDLVPEWKGNLFIGGLASRALVRLVVDAQGKVTGEERLLRDMQPRERIRDVKQGPDGALYVITDSPKGRVLRIAPRK
jgi:glucose/arabinose dehydrogenase